MGISIITLKSCGRFLPDGGPARLISGHHPGTQQATPELLSGKAKTLALSDEAKELVVKFAAAALVQLIESLAH